MIELAIDILNTILKISEWIFESEGKTGCLTKIKIIAFFLLGVIWEINGMFPMSVKNENDLKLR